MKISKTQFDFVTEDLQAGRNIKETAIAHLLSERQVQRIKEAGTWERWPYIVAKTTHGYNTPEYKLYLKRRGLPLTPPARYKVAPREKQLHQIQKSLHSEMETRRRSLLDRILRRK
jgi:hypothetical protein